MNTTLLTQEDKQILLSRLNNHTVLPLFLAEVIWLSAFLSIVICALFWTSKILFFIITLRIIICTLKHPAIFSPNPRHEAPPVFICKKSIIYILVCMVLFLIFYVDTA
jgi:hypothetical protein